MPKLVSRLPEQRPRKIMERPEARRDDEIAESIKVTMKALNDFFGSRVASKEGRLRAVGSEFGHMVAKNITRSDNPTVLLSEIASFWNTNGLGEMEIVKGQPLTFTVRTATTAWGPRQENLYARSKRASACKFRVVPFDSSPE